MCGIAGYFLKTGHDGRSGDIGLLLDAIRKRGPDDEGVCLISRGEKRSRLYKTDRTVSRLGAALPHIKDKESLVKHDLALIHSRYAIIDLSEGGHQPFVSRDGSVIAIFNGEIYNYIELRDELSVLGVSFRTSSDTEVLVEGYRVWGERLWPRMNGFWAVALYDSGKDALILSRDRIGVAPLYYRETEKGLFFASYIKPLIDIDPEGVSIDRDVVLGFLETGIKDHDNSTYYPEIKSVPSASTVTFDPGKYAMREAACTKYWDFPDSRLTSRDMSFEDAVKKYRETFFRAVELRLRSDVKVAFELSGGLDSSSVVAAAAELRGKDITTYTVKVKGADEEPYARSILERYPVDYRVLSDLEDNFTAEYESFSETMEEPYDNPANYNHHKMLKIMKREKVHVVVTGAGGDEVLAGYETSFWPKAYQEMKKDGPGSFLAADWYEFVKRFKTVKSSYATMRHYLMDPFKIVHKRIFGPIRPGERSLGRTRASFYDERYQELSFQGRALYHFNVALVPYYMRSTDHYTMGIPVEHRFPFLDYRMVELGMRMPIPYLFKGGWTKYILRKAMEPYLPKKILWRKKKMGFPFAFRRYLTLNKAVFEPLLKSPAMTGLSMDGFGDYGLLLKTDPVLLWRVISTAVWLKTNAKHCKG